MLTAAMQIVDEQGLAALSMRRLGDALGVEAMSLYNHVPSKAALLDGLHERALEEMQLPCVTGRWRIDVRALALSFRAVLDAHPNLLPIFSARPAITEGSLRFVERALASLAEPFPELPARVVAFQSVVAWVIGQAIVTLDAPTALDYASLSEADFPTLSAVGRCGALSTRREVFVSGLDALIRGWQVASPGGG